MHVILVDGVGNARGFDRPDTRKVIVEGGRSFVRDETKTGLVLINGEHIPLYFLEGYPRANTLRWPRFA